MATHKEIIDNIKPIFEDEEKMIVDFDDYGYIERTEGDHEAHTGILLWRGKRVYRTNDL